MHLPITLHSPNILHLQPNLSTSYIAQPYAPPSPLPRCCQSYAVASLPPVYTAHTRLSTPHSIPKAPSHTQYTHTLLLPLHPYTLTPLHPKSVNHSRKKLVGLPQEELGAVSVREFLLLISRDWLHTVHSFIHGLHDLSIPSSPHDASRARCG